MQNTSDRTVTRVRHPSVPLAAGPARAHRLRVTRRRSRGFRIRVVRRSREGIFPPPAAERPVLPTLGANGPEFPEGEPKPDARDFTPRRFDRAARPIWNSC